jgi:hypothetical protein
MSTDPNPSDPAETAGALPRGEYPRPQFVRRGLALPRWLGVCYFSLEAAWYSAKSLR